MKTSSRPFVPSVRFLVSAAHYSQMPVAQVPEFCLLGRSNVGKSSFINHVFKTRHLARVGKAPGKTTLANFFKVGDDSIWVDLPGYGYARASQNEKRRWSQLIADYCTQRATLKGAIWLLDIRHPGHSVDLQADAWCRDLDLKRFVVLTKADKFGRNAARQSADKHVRALNLSETPLLFSTRDPGAADRFWQAFSDWREKQ